MTIAPSTGRATTMPEDRSRRVRALAVATLMLPCVMAQQDVVSVRFEPGCEQVKAYFDNDLSNATSYLWDFGDGTTSTLARPIHTFPYGEPLTVQLTAVVDGQPVSFTRQYQTQEQLDLGTIELPNVFTPNGDGRNDLFAPVNEVFLGPCAQLAIYDRYGQLMFESVGNNLSWDGRTIAGASASDGVYFYVFSWGGGTLNSTVTLIR
ncbi:MAG: gliding motility-associated C-terminal domain-containing protein [Flavobacteriales bacterium]